MSRASFLPALLRKKSRAAAAQRPSPRADQAIQAVLSLLRERMGMDVVFVRHYVEGERRFRQVEALSHGRAAAMAAGQPADDASGVLLEASVVLPDGRVHGLLCCFSPGEDAALHERHLRSLRHGARLAAQLLDNQEVLQELARQDSRRRGAMLGEASWHAPG